MCRKLATVASPAGAVLGSHPAGRQGLEPEKGISTAQRRGVIRDGQRPQAAGSGRSGGGSVTMPVRRQGVIPPGGSLLARHGAERRAVWPARPGSEGPVSVGGERAAPAIRPGDERRASSAGRGTLPAGVRRAARGTADEAGGPVVEPATLRGCEFPSGTQRGTRGEPPDTRGAS